MPDEIYKKNPDGTFEQVGWDWTGFPANGIWYVKDGTRNCLIKISDIDTKPSAFLEVSQYKEECVKFLIKRAQSQEYYNLDELAKWAAEFYAQKLEGGQ